MTNSELKQFYPQFIEMIGNQPDGLGDGIGLHGFLNDVAEHLRGIGKQKRKAWSESDFSLPDNGSNWIKDAEALETITGKMKPKKQVYTVIASLFNAWQHCQENGNQFAAKHEATIERIMKETAPHGSGFDNGTRFDFDASDYGKLVFTFGYHHMDGGGYYCGWTEQTLTVTPSFIGGFDFEIVMEGSPDDEEFYLEGFMEYINQTIDYWLSQEINETDFV